MGHPQEEPRCRLLDCLGPRGVAWAEVRDCVAQVVWEKVWCDGQREPQTADIKGLGRGLGACRKDRGTLARAEKVKGGHYR